MLGAAGDVIRLTGESTISWAEFNLDWYLHAYPEVRMAVCPDDSAAVLQYYLITGQQIGHSPNPYFDETWYLQQCSEAAEAKRAWEERLGENVTVFVTSSATRQGLDELATELLRRVPVRDAVVEEELEDVAELAEHRVFKPAARRGFLVSRVEDGLFRVEGDAVDRLIARHDLDNEDALIHVEGRLRRMGVMRALEAAGFEPGDDVEIAGIVFELVRHRRHEAVGDAGPGEDSTGLVGGHGLHSRRPDVDAYRDRT